MLTRKLGPLPMWAWMGMVLLVVLGYSLWHKDKTDAASSSAATTVPDQTPPVVFQSYVYDTDYQTSGGVSTPPVAGRPVPPAGPPIGRPPAPVPPQPRPTGGPPSPVPAPRGQWVTVSKYVGPNPVWSSTLWGIAQHLLGNGSRWSEIWGAPQNAALKSRRKDPRHIQPGDRVWVP